MTATDVRRLHPLRRERSLSLDWRASDAALLELSHTLLTQIASETPSEALEERFALQVLTRLPQGGFVLDEDVIWRWLELTSEAHDFVRTNPRRTHSWLARLLASLPGFRRDVRLRPPRADWRTP